MELCSGRECVTEGENTEMNEEEKVVGAGC